MDANGLPTEPWKRAAPAPAPEAPKAPKVFTAPKASSPPPAMPEHPAPDKSGPSTGKSAKHGAEAGAAIGELVGPEGAAAGAVIGGGLGAVKGHHGKAKAARKAARSAKIASLGGGRQLLVGEFLICMIIVALSPLADKHKSDGPQEFIKRMAAVCATFFILGIISSAGRGPTKVAAGLGGLVALSLAVSDRDVFTALAAKIGAADASGDGSTDGSGEGDDQGNPDQTPGPLGNGIR